MKPKILSNYFMFCALQCTLLGAISPLTAKDQKEITIHLSEVELQEIFNNPKRSYIYIGEQVSSLAQVIEEISQLDDNQDSLLRALVDHIKKGFVIGNYDAVAQALEDASVLLHKHGNKLDQEKASALSQALNVVIEQVIEEKLTLDAELLSFLKDSIDSPEETKTQGYMERHGLQLLVIKGKMDVYGKTKFRKDVTFKDHVQFNEFSSFHGNAHFRKDVEVFGTLSAGESIASCDLTVGCNINLNDSGSSSVGNIFKAADSFIHNYGQDNTFVGINAGNFSMTGIDNAGFGVNTLSNVTTGNDNIAVGNNAGISLTTGSGNIYINADAGSASESNTTRIGTSQTSCFIQGISGITTGLTAIPVLVAANGQLGTISSSRTVKHDIEDMDDASAHILDLRPVTFVYNEDETKTVQYGLIAEEVDQLFPAIVVHNEDGTAFTVQYHVLPVLLLNELKKLAARVATLEARS